MPFSRNQISTILDRRTVSREIRCWLPQSRGLYAIPSSNTTNSNSGNLISRRVHPHELRTIHRLRYTDAQSYYQYSRNRSETAEGTRWCQLFLATQNKQWKHFQSWNAILALRQKAILISFGSVAKSADLPSTLKNSIATVIGRFPDITFIWKYENPEDAFAKVILFWSCQELRSAQETKAALPNLHFTSWMPQNDLLNDDRIVVFVTHGGMGSTQETALRGKPGIIWNLESMRISFSRYFRSNLWRSATKRGNDGTQWTGKGLWSIIPSFSFAHLKVLDKFDLAYPDKVEAVIREVLTDNKWEFSKYK